MTNLKLIGALNGWMIDHYSTVATGQVIQIRVSARQTTGQSHHLLSSPTVIPYPAGTSTEPCQTSPSVQARMAEVEEGSQVPSGAQSPTNVSFRP